MAFAVFQCLVATRVGGCKAIRRHTGSPVLWLCRELRVPTGSLWWRLTREERDMMSQGRASGTRPVCGGLGQLWPELCHQLLGWLGRMVLLCALDGGARGHGAQHSFHTAGEPGCSLRDEQTYPGQVLVLTKRIYSSELFPRTS